MLFPPLPIFRIPGNRDFVDRHPMNREIVMDKRLMDGVVTTSTNDNRDSSNGLKERPRGDGYQIG